MENNVKDIRAQHAKQAAAQAEGVAAMNNADIEGDNAAMEESDDEDEERTIVCKKEDNYESLQNSTNMREYDKDYRYEQESWSKQDSEAIPYMEAGKGTMST
ncbi:hypothetical protein HHX47_DHR2001177 [Lentinula edodes]|nr:hypothetical protein HHX47_DHR2001177 [Lentinula edodes]